MKKYSLLSLTVLLIVVLSFSTALAYNEAPMLKEKVEQGLLPPVDERLPEDPMVIEPVYEIGKYGGTWKRFDTSEGWPCMKMVLDGDNFTHFQDKDLKTMSQLVSKWETNEDKTIWTFYFRKGLKWSDGEPFTVDDFLFYWNDMVLNSDYSTAMPDRFKADGKPMEVTRIDDYTLQFKFIAPNPTLADKLAMWANYSHNNNIYPAHYLKQFHPDYSDYTDYTKFDKMKDWATNAEIPVMFAWKPVKIEPGKVAILERNPYYYAVDTAGNQLPYIDRIEVEYVSDEELYKLKLMQGESDMQIRPELSIRDISLLKQNEEKYNFKSLVWQGGSGTGPLFLINHNYPEEEKRTLYRNPTFLKALSHAIDRPNIQKVVYYGFGFPTTGTFSPFAKDFMGEDGQKLFEKWRDSAVEYNPEQAKEMLEKVGVFDQNGDGWRQLPSGKELTIRIDTSTTGKNATVDVIETVKKNWDAVGLKTVINTISWANSGTLHAEATFDIDAGWDCCDGLSIVTEPEFLIPMEKHHWAPLYGVWYSVKGTERENTELEKDPRDRKPPREQPEPGSSVDRLQKLYAQLKSVTKSEEEKQLVEKIVNIHIEEGPFMIGVVANSPAIGVVKNFFKNVPEKLSSGWTGDWKLGYPAVLNPEQFYIDK